MNNNLIVYDLDKVISELKQEIQNGTIIIETGKDKLFDIIQNGVEKDISVFDDYQLYQIEKGKEEGLDVSYYSNPKLTASQMEEIRFGLEMGLDVSVYASPLFDWMQMKQIRFGLEDGFDVKTYADPKLNWEQMRDIRQSYGMKKELEKIKEESEFPFYIEPDI